MIAMGWLPLAHAQSIEWNEPAAIRSMTNVWTEQNRKSAVLEGWRVQIASSNDRFQIQSEKERFIGLYPSVSCDWYHEKPFYKLKAGAFRHSWEARKLIAQINGDFKSSYPVFDKKIKPMDFLTIGTE